MQTGVISFCDRIAFNIKSSETKDEITDLLERRFGVRILQKHWHRLDQEGKAHLQRSPHLACLRSNGNPYYMFFTRYEDTPILYFIDKKIQPGYQKPRVIIAHGQFDEALFDNTLLDGEMVKDKEGRWLFLFNDMLAFRNTYLDKEPLSQRLQRIHQMLEASYQPDPCMDVCQYHVKRYAQCTKEGVMALQAFAEDLPYTNRGIYFWSTQLRFRPKLFNFDESLIKEVRRTVKDRPEFRELKQAVSDTDHEEEPSPPVHVVTTPIEAPEGTQVFWLRKTEHPDVYDLYPHEHGNQASRVGTAHIPNLMASRMLRDVFKDVTVAVSKAYHCSYNNTFQKWMPVEPVVA